MLLSRSARIKSSRLTMPISSPFETTGAPEMRDWRNSSNTSAILVPGAIVFTLRAITSPMVNS